MTETLCPCCGLHMVDHEDLPVEVTAEDITEDIKRWKFDYTIEGTFGSYLMKKYPNGFKVVP